jgi:hypothetical protein
MHGTEPCILKRRTPRLSAPHMPFLPASGSLLSSAPQPLTSERDRTLVTAFRSPATVPAFTGSIPGSKFLACYFTPSPIGSAVRSAFGSTTLTGLPRSGLLLCFWPVTAFPNDSPDCATNLHSPLGLFGPSGSKRSTDIAAGRPAFRIRPISSRSPQPQSIASFWLRINAPGPLRFRRLAVPQTSWNLSQYAPEPFYGQSFYVLGRTFSTKILDPYFHKVTDRLRCNLCG